jgi:hypothetical protein
MERQDRGPAISEQSLSVYTGILEHAFDRLNERYFEGALPRPVLTIQSSVGSYGHCTLKRLWRGKDKAYYEINIGAENMHRPPANLAATLVHEMVHLYCIINGIKDTSRNCTYHNKTFKAQAEARGLVIGHTKAHGWTATTPSDGLAAFAAEAFCGAGGWGLHRLGPYEAVPKGAEDGTEDGGGDGEGATRPKGTSTKYACPSCKSSVRATKQVRVKCMDCDEEMTAC